MSTWIATIPEADVCKRKIYKFFDTQDIKKWVWCRETGKDGYRHIHIRFEWLDRDKPDAFSIWKDWFRSAHIEYARTDCWDYEKKQGHYFCWDDTEDKLVERFGPLRENQKEILALLDRTNNREIVCYVDEIGGMGKSHLCGALWERRIGFYCPPFLNGVKDIVQFVASGYDQEKYIIIDMPRDMKWNKDLYTGIEAIKDGLVVDCRYSAKTRNIKGVKVLVLTNTRPRLDRLSADRWVFYEPSTGNTKDGSIPLGIEGD